jgi:hypothetical protein
MNLWQVVVPIIVAVFSVSVIPAATAFATKYINAKTDARIDRREAVSELVALTLEEAQLSPFDSLVDAADPFRPTDEEKEQQKQGLLLYREKRIKLDRKLNRARASVTLLARSDATIALRYVDQIALLNQSRVHTYSDFTATLALWSRNERQGQKVMSAALAAYDRKEAQQNAEREAESS